MDNKIKGCKDGLPCIEGEGHYEICFVSLDDKGKEICFSDVRKFSIFGDENNAKQKS